MSDLKEIMQKHVGRKMDVCKLVADILSVDIGVKAAYLYDVGAPNAEKLKCLLKEFQAHGIIQNALNVVELGMDCLIVNVEELKKMSYGNVQDSYIDVSEGLEKPKIGVGSNAVENVRTAVQDIVNNLDSHSIKVYSYHSSKCCNISSVFGALLNYPVIYWYDTTDDKYENCLSVEKLTVVKLQVTFLTTGHRNRHLMKLFGETYNHCLYQFSYPSGLAEHCQPIVDKWLDVINDKIRESVILNESIVSYQEEVLSSVVL